MTDVSTHYYGDDCVPPHRQPARDRLREAADLIGSVEVSEWSDDCYVPTPFARATAALLRAVADEATVCQCRSSYYRQPCQKHEEANETLAAALTLADVILGAES